MKKLLLLTALVAFAFLANAQTYKAFKVDIDFGYAIPSSSGGTKAGANFTIEPHYRLSDAFALGLRLEGTALAYQNGVSSDDTKVSLLTSYSLTGDFYLANGGFRPFIGGGAGLFAQSSLDVSGGSSTVTIPSSSKFGFFPRLGFEAGHLRLSATYNILGDNANYTAFTIGFFLGGGKK